MARDWHVFPGRSVAKDDQVVINDIALSQDSSEFVLTFGPRDFQTQINDVLDIPSSTFAVEQNKYDLIITNPVNLTDTRSAALIPVSDPGVKIGTSHYAPEIPNVTQRFEFYDDMLNGPGGFRHFSGTAVGKWASDNILQEILARPHIQWIWQSFKGTATNGISGNLDWTAADLETWWGQSAFPENKTIYLSWWHEPEDNWTTVAEKAEYRARWRALSDYVRANGPSNIVLAGPVWQGASFRASTGRPPQDWWPGNNYFDVTALDLYMRSFLATEAQDGYADYGTRVWEGPGEVWPQIDQFVSTTGKFAIAELASPNVDDPGVNGNYTPDPGGVRRAEWCQNTVDWLFSGPFADRLDLICWWNSVDNFDMRLHIDQLCPPIWADACTASREAYGIPYND